MDTHLTPALVSAPSFERAATPAITKARAPLELARGEVLALHGRRGQTLEVLSGRLWLTQTGDTGDHFVAGGEHHTLRASGRLVIEGDSAAPAQWRWRR